MKNIFYSIMIAFIFLQSCNSSKKINTLSAAQKKDGWQLLFDGITTNGWHTFNKTTIGPVWKVDSGALHLHGSKTDDWQTLGGHDIICEKEFKNFHLKIDWKIALAGNSGVMFYCQEGKQYGYPWETGIESQVIDNQNSGDSKIIKCRGGDFYDLVSCNTDVVKPGGQWNHLEIICNNGHVDEILNGTKVIYINAWDDKWKKLIAATKFKDMPGFGMFTSGKIALQDEGNDVWFKNIMIKEL